MFRDRKYVGFTFVIVLLSLSLWALASCGGGGGGSTGGGTKLTATQQAAASASAAQGAIAMTSNIGSAADMATGYIPARYAPAKAPTASSTDAISNIDPRLKTTVDKMLAMVNKHKAANVSAKAGLSNKVLSSVSTGATITCDGGTGTIVVSGITSTTATSTTNTLSITYSNCRDDFFASIANGTLTAVNTIDSVATSETGSVVINLTDTIYTDTFYNVQSEIFSLNGTFISAVTGTVGATSSGTASARGAFTWTFIDTVNGNMVMSFSFGSGNIPVTDTWSKLVSGGTTTETHTANGTYSLGISAGGQSITLGITLASLTDMMVMTGGATDETINGSLSIGWTPNLSEYGCLNGTYTFTTIAPIHYVGYDCPTSGQLRVNNAVIEFGNPSGYNVRVTLDSGPTEVFADCYSLGGDMCSSGGSAGTPAPPSTPAAGP